MRVGGPRGTADFHVGRALDPIGDVGGDRIVEEHGLLRHDAHRSAQTRDRPVPHIHTIHGHATGGHVVEPPDEVGERSFSRSTRSNQSHDASRGDLGVDVPEYRLTRLRLEGDRPDTYVKHIRKLIRRGPEFYFLDRLLTASVIETRGAERFALIAQALESGSLKEFYERIARSEQRHGSLFLRLACNYFEPETVLERVEELLELEGEILLELPIQPVLH